jgi:hypothetical protein
MFLHCSPRRSWRFLASSGLDSETIRLGREVGDRETLREKASRCGGAQPS